MKDTDILKLFMQRDERAVRETQKAYGALLHALANRILGSSEDAEECVNDVLLRAWNAIPPEHPEHFRAYLAALTRRLALNRLTAQNRIKRGGGQVPAVLDELAECLPAEDDVMQTVENRAVIEGLERFLQRLPRRQCRIFMLRYFSFMQTDEIAAELRLSENTVKSTLRRTRIKLEAFLRKEELL